MLLTTYEWISLTSNLCPATLQARCFDSSTAVQGQIHSRDEYQEGRARPATAGIAHLHINNTWPVQGVRRIEIEVHESES